MGVGNIVLKLVALVIVAVGVTLIFEARPITKKWFSFGDRNEGAKWIKVVGFVVAVAGSILFMVSWQNWKKEK